MARSDAPPSSPWPPRLDPDLAPAAERAAQQLLLLLSCRRQQLAIGRLRQLATGAYGSSKEAPNCLSLAAPIGKATCSRTQPAGSRLALPVLSPLPCRGVPSQLLSLYSRIQILIEQINVTPTMSRRTPLSNFSKGYDSAIISHSTMNGSKGVKYFGVIFGDPQAWDLFEVLCIVYCQTGV
ncbi:hypothetical protein EJB05_26964, partial [Eragrostis curvula]